MSGLYLIGFVQTIFLAILILTKKKLKLSDVFLFFFILLMGLRLLNIYFGEIGYYELYPKIVRLIEFIYWPLFGPLLYLYIKTIISSKNKFKIEYLIHFIPAIIVVVAFTDFVYSNYEITLNEYCQKAVFFQIGKYLWYFTTHFYFFLSVIVLHKYRRRVKHYFSYKKDIDLKWLLVLTYGFGLFLFTSMFFILTHNIINIEFPEFSHYISWFIMVVYIFGIGFYGYKQKWIFTTSNEFAKEIEEEREINKIEKKHFFENFEESTQYKKTKLEDKKSDTILKGLLEYMTVDKPYLNSELNIKILSNEINTSLHKLSQVINSNLNKNFFEFVNEYRIKEAQIYLKNPQFAQEKIMNIAYDCGFSSKSSFFSVFKKITSQTPAEYKKKHLTN